jgi:hypothetical protein
MYRISVTHSILALDLSSPKLLICPPAYLNDGVSRGEYPPTMCCEAQYVHEYSRCAHQWGKNRALVRYSITYLLVLSNPRPGRLLPVDVRDE